MRAVSTASASVPMGSDVHHEGHGVHILRWLAGRIVDGAQGSTSPRRMA